MYLKVNTFIRPPLHYHKNNQHKEKGNVSFSVVYIQVWLNIAVVYFERYSWRNLN